MGQSDIKADPQLPAPDGRAQNRGRGVRRGDHERFMTAEAQLVTRTSLRYSRMIDFIVLNLGATTQDVATHMDYSKSYTAHLMSSDAFKEALAIRVRENQLFLGATLVTKTQRVVEAALGAMENQINNLGETMPHSELRETSDVLLQRLGFAKEVNGDATPASASVHVEINGDLLSRAREKAENRARDVTPSLAPPLLSHDAQSAQSANKAGMGPGASKGKSTEDTDA